MIVVDRWPLSFRAVRRIPTTDDATPLEARIHHRNSDFTNRPNGRTLWGAGQATAGGEKTPRGKSGHRRAWRWVTPTRGDPRESATETHGRWRGCTCAAYRQR